jgi:hypothetical protein
MRPGQLQASFSCLPVYVLEADLYFVMSGRLAGSLNELPGGQDFKITRFRPSGGHR